MFSLYINKFIDKMSSSGIKGFEFFSEIIEILLIFFADDKALLSDTLGLQRQLRQVFCDDHQMEDKTIKTKILVFRKEVNLSRREKWICKGTTLKVINGLHCVGLPFTPQMSLNCMVNDLALKKKKKN